MTRPPPFPPPAEPTSRARSGSAAVVLGFVTCVAVLVGFAGLAYALLADGDGNRAATPFADVAVGMGLTVAAGAFAVALLCGILSWRSRSPSDC